jgi:hypothetical protein
MLLASVGLTADPALMAIGQAAGSGPEPIERMRVA